MKNLTTKTAAEVCSYRAMEARLNEILDEHDAEGRRLEGLANMILDQNEESMSMRQVGQVFGRENVVVYL